MSCGVFVIIDISVDFGDLSFVMYGKQEFLHENRNKKAEKIMNIRKASLIYGTYMMRSAQSLPYIERTQGYINKTQ